MQGKDVHQYLHNLKIVFDHYGMEAQLGQLSEECNELAIAAHHYQREIKKDNPPSTNMSAILNRNMEIHKVREGLISELADVLNLMEQLVRDMDIGAMVDAERCRKMEREVKRIQKGGKKDKLSSIVDAGLMMAKDYSDLVDKLGSFVRTTKFVHPHSAEEMLRQAIADSQLRISTWRKVLKEHEND